jgi:phage RecT family recombinase
MAEQQQSNPLQTVLNTLRAPEYQDILRKSLSDPKKLDAFTEATAAALRSNPKVFVDCEKTSLYNAILEAARRGIVPDGKQGALAPFSTKVSKNPDRWVTKAQFMIMPQGIIDAFAKVGITAYAQSVYENDNFKFWSDDTGQHVDHRYNPFHDRGARIGAYAAGVTKGGKTYVEAMNADELARARAKSKTPDKGPWVEWPERMEQKSALHRLDKRMPGAGVAGDEDVEPETVVQTVEAQAPPADVGTNQGGNEQAKAAAITDETKRPRGLQSIIDSEIEPEPEKVQSNQAAQSQVTQGSTIEQAEGGSPF